MLHLANHKEKMYSECNMDKISYLDIRDVTNFPLCLQFNAIQCWLSRTTIISFTCFLSKKIKTIWKKNTFHLSAVENALISVDIFSDFHHQISISPQSASVWPNAANQRLLFTINANALDWEQFPLLFCFFFGVKKRI